MHSLEEMKAWLRRDLAHYPLNLATETIPLSQALGRVLAAPVDAAQDMPAEALSAMDGYAFAFAEGLQTLTLLGRSTAGHPYAGPPLAAGQAVRIMTGAVLPAGADTVVMQEDTQEQAGQLQLQPCPPPGANVRPRGDMLQAGTRALAPNTRINAPVLALLAALGQAELCVYAPLKVGLFSTGDELRNPGTALDAPGTLYDSNRPMLQAMLSRLPVQVVDYGLIPDQPEAIRATLAQAARECAVVLTSAGVSVGDCDYLRAAVAELGTIHHYKVKMKPGKPFVYGRIAQAWYFGLPGNPVSSFVTMAQLVLPALAQLLQPESDAYAPLTLMAQLQHDLPHKAGRTSFVMARLAGDERAWTVTSLGEGSHRLDRLAQANAFIVIPETVGALAAGTMVSVQPWAWGISG